MEKSKKTFFRLSIDFPVSSFPLCFKGFGLFQFSAIFANFGSSGNFLIRVYPRKSAVWFPDYGDVGDAIPAIFSSSA